MRNIKPFLAIFLCLITVSSTASAVAIRVNVKRNGWINRDHIGELTIEPVRGTSFYTVKRGDYGSDSIFLDKAEAKEAASARNYQLRENGQVGVWKVVEIKMTDSAGVTKTAWELYDSSAY